jgi:acyl transferase domain-containing protein
MLAIATTVQEAAEWLEGMEADVSIATVNGPYAVVVSGKGEAVDTVADLAQMAGRRTKELVVSHAFHSPLMNPILEELSQVASSLHISPPAIPIVSNVTGDFMTGDMTGDYWSSHVRQAVLFHEGMSKIMEAGASLLIEIGPHPALTQAVATSFDTTKFHSAATLLRDQEDISNILGTLASLHVKGIPLNLDRLFWSPVYRRISLPLYPFRRDRHWIRPETGIDLPPEVSALNQMESFEELKALQERVDLHPILGQVAAVGPRRVVFESSLKTTHPWTDHRVLGSTVFPGTAYLEMAARGFAAVGGQDWRSVKLRDVVFERPLVLTFRKPKTVHLTLENLPVKGLGVATLTMAAAESGGRES